MFVHTFGESNGFDLHYAVVSQLEFGFEKYRRVKVKKKNFSGKKNFKGTFNRPFNISFTKNSWKGLLIYLLIYLLIDFLLKIPERDF